MLTWRNDANYFASRHPIDFIAWTEVVLLAINIGTVTWYLDVIFAIRDYPYYSKDEILVKVRQKRTIGPVLRSRSAMGSQVLRRVRLSWRARYRIERQDACDWRILSVDQSGLWEEVQLRHQKDNFNLRATSTGRSFAGDESM